MSIGTTYKNADAPTLAGDQAIRRAAMEVLAEATSREISEGLTRIGVPIDCRDVRPAEIGMVMIRGRIGGDGAPFNIGEATVTRCAVQLQSGEIGFSYALGRDREKARLAAICDALIQTDTHRLLVERDVVAPIRERQKRDRSLAAGRTAATKVDFFTLVRGED